MQPESRTYDFLPSVDYTHVLSASASFKDLVTVAQTHTNQKMSCGGVRELHKLNSRTEHRSFIQRIIQHMC